MKLTLPLILLALVLTGLGCFGNKTEETVSSGSVEIDRGAILLEARENGLIMSESEVAVMSSVEPTSVQGAVNVTNVEPYLKADMKGWASAALADVTGGDSFGLAHAAFARGVYTFVADMGNLEAPRDGYAYHGWLVNRTEPLAAVGTAAAVKTQSGYAIVFTAAEDLTAYDFFVLTLEQTAGATTPEEHILEGSFR
ncbi:hypothetical protein HY631_03660 [Candidatus Uhrbacteria bacterium]|nr:hypothetical protein [Candidatus Uhrbacteria bacterium]